MDQNRDNFSNSDLYLARNDFDDEFDSLILDRIDNGYYFEPGNFNTSPSDNANDFGLSGFSTESGSNNHESVASESLPHSRRYQSQEQEGHQVMQPSQPAQAAEGELAWEDLLWDPTGEQHGVGIGHENVTEDLEATIPDVDVNDDDQDEDENVAAVTAAVGGASKRSSRKRTRVEAPVEAAKFKKMKKRHEQTRVKKITAHRDFVAGVVGGKDSHGVELVGVVKHMANTMEEMGVDADIVEKAKRKMGEHVIALVQRLESDGAKKGKKAKQQEEEQEQEQEQEEEEEENLDQE